MYPCKKCLENNWHYNYIDGYVIATCENCGFETNWQAKQEIKNRAL